MSASVRACRSPRNAKDPFRPVENGRNGPVTGRSGQLVTLLLMEAAGIEPGGRSSQTVAGQRLGKWGGRPASPLPPWESQWLSESGRNRR